MEASADCLWSTDTGTNFGILSTRRAAAFNILWTRSISVLQWCQIGPSCNYIQPLWQQMNVSGFLWHWHWGIDALSVYVAADRNERGILPIWTFILCVISILLKPSTSSPRNFEYIRRKRERIRVVRALIPAAPRYWWGATRSEGCRFERTAFRSRTNDSSQWVKCSTVDSIWYSEYLNEDVVIHRVERGVCRYTEFLVRLIHFS